MTGTGTDISVLTGGSGHPRGLLDLGDRACARIEELILDLRPAPKAVDREQRLRGWELARELLRHRLHDWPVTLLGPERLRRRCPEPVQERLGLGEMRGLRDHRRRRLDQDRLLRNEVLDRIAGLLGGDGIAL